MPSYSRPKRKKELLGPLPPPYCHALCFQASPNKMHLCLLPFGYKLGRSCRNLTHKHTIVSGPSVCICPAQRQADGTSLPHLQCSPRLQSNITEGAGFLEELPCTEKLTLGLSKLFPVYVIHPIPAACRAEGRASEQRGWPEGRLASQGSHLTGAERLWGHNPQSQRQNGNPGVAEGGTAKHPTPS